MNPVRSFCIALALLGCAHVAHAQAPALFGPASENSLTPGELTSLSHTRASKYFKAAYPLYVNRLAIDSEAIIVEIDSKKHLFVGSLNIGAFNWDTWTGQSESGGRAEISRAADLMMGSIHVDGRIFGFGGTGEYVVFRERDLDPPPMTVEEAAKGEADFAESERRRKERLSRQASPQRIPAPPTKDEECAAIATEVLPRWDRYLRLPQPPHMRRWIEEFRAETLLRQFALGCSRMS